MKQIFPIFTKWENLHTISHFHHPKPTIFHHKHSNNLQAPITQPAPPRIRKHTHTQTQRMHLQVVALQWALCRSVPIGGFGTRPLNTKPIVALSRPLLYSTAHSLRCGRIYCKYIRPYRAWGIPLRWGKFVGKFGPRSIYGCPLLRNLLDLFYDFRLKFEIVYFHLTGSFLMKMWKLRTFSRVS